MATPTTLPATFVAGNVLTAAQMNNLRGAFRVLQVASTTKTDTFSMATATYTDVTGLSVSITPSSTSSKVLVIATLQIAGTSAYHGQLMRDSTAIGIGDAAGSRTRVTANGFQSDPNSLAGFAMLVLDSPATTSATTYKVQVRNNVTSQTLWVNRTNNDTDTGQWPRAASTITVMEISA